MKIGKLVMIGLVVGLLLVTLRESLAADANWEAGDIPDGTLQQFATAFGIKSPMYTKYPYRDGVAGPDCWSVRRPGPGKSGLQRSDSVLAFFLHPGSCHPINTTSR